MSVFSSGSRKPSFSEYEQFGKNWEQAAIELRKRGREHKNERRKAEDERDQLRKELEAIRSPPQADAKTDLGPVEAYQALSGQLDREKPVAFWELQQALSGFGRTYAEPDDIEPSDPNLNVRKQVQETIRDQPPEYFWFHGKEIIEGLCEYLCTYAAQVIKEEAAEITPERYLEIHDQITDGLKDHFVNAAFHWNKYHKRFRNTFTTLQDELQQAKKGHCTNPADHEQLQTISKKYTEALATLEEAQRERCSDPLAHVELANQEQENTVVKQLQEQIRLKDQEHVANIAKQIKEKDREIANLQALRCQKPSDHNQLPKELAEQKLVTEEYRQRYENSQKTQGCPQPDEHQKLRDVQQANQIHVDGLTKHILALAKALGDKAELTTQIKQLKEKHSQEKEQILSKIYESIEYGLLDIQCPNPPDHARVDELENILLELGYIEDVVNGETKWVKDNGSDSGHASE